MYRYNPNTVITTHSHYFKLTEMSGISVNAFSKSVSVTPPDPDDVPLVVVAIRATLDGRGGTRAAVELRPERVEPNVLALPDELTLSLS